MITSGAGVCPMTQMMPLSYTLPPSPPPSLSLPSLLPLSPSLPSLPSELLQPDLLEDAIVSVCLKQHGLETALRLLGQSQSCGGGGGGGGEVAGKEMKDHCSLLDAMFTRINGLERRLQVWGGIYM